MSYIKIGNKLLSPAPFISVNKNLLFTDDGQPISSEFLVEFTGTLLPGVGSPSSTGWTTGYGIPNSEVFNTDNDKFESLLCKQDLLREAFDIAGVPIVYKASGFDEVSFYGNLQSINFTPNPWVIRSDYTLRLSTPVLNKVNSSGIEDQFLVRTSGLFLKSVADNWSISTSPESTGLYQVARTTSAVGLAYVASGTVLATGDSQAWLNARKWVLDRIATYPAMSFSSLFPSGYNASGYNSIREESIDALGGSYALTQRYQYSQNPNTEQQTISRTLTRDLLDDGGPTVLNISVNGVITGYDVNNVPSGRLENARTRYTAISGGIAAGVGATGPALSSTKNESIYDGVINYGFEFSNLLGSTYRHVYDVSFNQGDANPTVSVNGTIEGITTDGLPAGKFAAALAGWAIVDPNIKTNAFQYGDGTLFGYTNFEDQYSDIPSVNAISYQKAAGTISYNRTFVLGSGNLVPYNEDWTVETNTANASTVFVPGTATTVTIQGTITGLNASGNMIAKNLGALSGWNAVRPLLFTRANTYYTTVYTTGPALSSGVLSQSVVNNRLAATYGYNVVFSNQPRGSGLASDITVVVEELHNKDLYAIQNIPGRAAGPIIQNIGTVSERGRNITVNMIMGPKADNSYWGYSDITTPREIASGCYASIIGPNVRGVDYYISNKTDSWDYKNGVFSAAMSLVWASGVSV